MGRLQHGACLNVNYEYEGITITGVVGKPEIARSNRGNQIFFVNKRYVRDRILSNATEKAFKGMIPIGKFGFLVLNLEMLPSTVDVNVHPAKLEVRFQEEQKVFKAVYCGIQDTLLKAELIANSETQISGRLDKEKVEGEQMEEGEETKSTISGLFRRIAKNANSDDYDDNNLIESIYKSKNGGSEIEQKENLMQEDKTNYAEKKDDKAQDTKQNNDITNTFNSINNNSYTNRDFFEQKNQSNNNSGIQNEDAIKNTINELMQMGKGLTAEQIREKISKIAMQNQSNEPNTVNASNTQEVEKKVENTYQNTQNINTKPKELSRKDMMDMAFSNFTLTPPKKPSVVTGIDKIGENTKNIENSFTRQNNIVLEEKEKYEVKQDKNEAQEIDKKEDTLKIDSNVRSKARRYTFKYYTRAK